MTKEGNNNIRMEINKLEKRKHRKWSQNLFLWKEWLSWPNLSLTDKKLNNLSQKYNWRCYYEPFRDREYCEQLYANKLENLEDIRKMEKLLEIHKLPKPVQEEREILWLSEFCWNLRIYENDWIFSSMNLLKFVLNVTLMSRKRYSELFAYD